MRPASKVTNYVLMWTAVLALSLPLMAEQPPDDEWFDDAFSFAPAEIVEVDEADVSRVEPGDGFLDDMVLALGQAAAPASDDGLGEFSEPTVESLADIQEIGSPASKIDSDPVPIELSYRDADERPVGEPISIVEAADTTSTNAVRNDPEILWPGFLWGLRGFEKMPKPVGMPLFFEDPFIYTGVNMFYLWHKFPREGALKGGDLQIWAMQVRVALTERLQFIATEDGYTKLRARALPPDEGWNDFTIGLKYALYYDVEDQFIVSGGMRWKWNNGSSGILKGNEDELSPFVSFAKGWGKFNSIGSITGRIPMDHHDANYSLVGSLHFDYELFKNFFPLMEFNFIQYLSDGDRYPLRVAGADYANIGANDVAGRTSFFGGVGFRYKFAPNIELGAIYQFPMMRPGVDLLDHRITVSMIVGL